MTRWLHAHLTVYLLLRQYGNGRLLGLWKLLGNVLGRGQHLNPDRWAWGPPVSRIERHAVIEEIQEAMNEIATGGRLGWQVRPGMRVKRFTMVGAMLVGFGRVPYRLVETTIPEDAKLEGGEWSQEHLELTLYLSHPSWPPLVAGRPVPDAEPPVYAVGRVGDPGRLYGGSGN